MYIIVKIVYHWNQICRTALFKLLSLVQSKMSYFHGLGNHRWTKNVSWFCKVPHYAVILLLIDWYFAFSLIKMFSDKSVFKVVYNFQATRSDERRIFIWSKSWGKLMFILLDGAVFLERYFQRCARLALYTILFSWVASHQKLQNKISKLHLKKIGDIKHIRLDRWI